MRDLATAIAATESLMDYKEGKGSHRTGGGEEVNDEGLKGSHRTGGGEEVPPEGSEDNQNTDGGNCNGSH